ncbi:MAG: indole-3-glycerol phosphate synthase TrpC [Alphaproteobacteria bacterium]|nr:MAG: indole-3-glycerol phosphate synthase TrpC [Alphaproteobacteria bacterium]
MSVLDRILTYKREEVAVRKQAKPWGAIESDAFAQPAPRDFYAALVAAADRPALIAEIKRASPSKGLIRADFEPAALARAYEAGGAACLSVLTDGPSFQGADVYLQQAKAACALPVLRKDFIVDPWQVFEARALGADAVLLIMAAFDVDQELAIHDAAHDCGLTLLVEVHDEAELSRALKLEARLIGVNNRSLATFKTDLGITERLAKLTPSDRLLVSESGISSHADIVRLQAAGAGAFLVGESLMRQDDVAAATRTLLGR